MDRTSDLSLFLSFFVICPNDYVAFKYWSGRENY